jgi:predicted DCC family thiol-disulfide oxidoreductase YuxK
MVKPPSVATPSWEIRVLFDGDCPLCRREIALLRRRDAGRGRIAFEDISAPGFDASRYGLDLDTAMRRIHGVLPDGSVIEGVEVFRRLYAAVGLGWLVAPTRWPLLRPLFDAAYAAFARNRLRLTGRTQPSCADGRCALASDARAPAAPDSAAPGSVPPGSVSPGSVPPRTAARG